MICQECKHLGIVSFSAMTESTCQNCLEKMMNSSSDIYKYCRDCAKKLNCCERCGSKLLKRDKED